jgi:hypothetical protein
MSSMWNVKVLNKGSKWIDLYVEFAHPDAGDFPENNTFALQLLTQAAYGFDDNYNYIAESPLGEAIPHEQSYQPFDLEPRVSEFVEKTVIYEARNLPWDESAAHEKMDELCKAEGLSPEDNNWEDRWHDHWRDFWADPNNLPWAKYRVWVTDDQWIEHLKVGQSFDTAAYAEQGPWIGEDRLIELEEPEDGTARQGVPGFKDSEIPPRDSVMNHDLICGLASSGGAMPEDELQVLLEQHQAFLAGDGAGGSWERLHVSGIPMNLYYGSSSGGEQLKLAMKLIDSNCTQLKGANMAYADLAGALMEEVDLSGCTLDGSLLTDGFFAEANFENASLKAVDFTGSDLTNANFRGADLTNADFEIANCTGADFTGANLTGATFKGAELKNVKR